VLTLRWRLSLGDDLPVDALAATRLAVELAEGWAVRVNGHVPPAATGRWLSQDVTLLAAGAHLHAGENWIELGGTYAEDQWLEAAYLLGNFAVTPSASGEQGGQDGGGGGRRARPRGAQRGGRATRVEDEAGGLTRVALAADGWPAFEVGRPPARLRGGAWATQGYPFFGGRLTAVQQITLDTAPAQAWLEFDQLPCAVRVRCNGAEAGVVAWRPYRAALHGLLRAGVNELEIEVASSLRNVLGPLHVDVRDAALVTPGHFLPSPLWQDAYLLAPEGLPAGGRLRLGSA
jgi:hypothetical protein